MLHQPGGGIRRHGILIKIADTDSKIRRVQAQQFFPAGLIYTIYFRLPR